MENTFNANRIATTGDARRMILDTITELRSGQMDIGRGVSIKLHVSVEEVRQIIDEVTV